MPNVAFCTLGCKVNQQETDSLRGLFMDAGYTAVSFDDPADVYVINTCTVTSASDKKSRNAISRAHARNPKAIVAVVGCYSQRAPEDVSALPGVALVVGAQHRDKLVEMVEKAREAEAALNFVDDIQTARVFETLPDARGTRTRVQLKVQDGCDRYCAYCIVPYARGPVRSLPICDAEAAIERIGETGELVLTGIHLMSYGKDIPGNPSITSLIAFAADSPGIGRVRLGSLEPALIDDNFVGALSRLPSNKLCHHFHLSLQSGSDTVLERMKRRYTTEDYRAAVIRLRSAFPDCAITTDVIAGFPGETGVEHNETLEFVARIGFSRLHVFPYSRREGTAAYGMPNQIRRIEKEMRARELIALGKTLEKKYLEAQIGTEQTVLAEESIHGWSEGYTANYIRARFRTPLLQTSGGVSRGLVDVRVIGAHDNVLLCEPDII